MKCGQELKKNQIFCEDCLAVMEAYPVKPGTPIQLPAQVPASQFPAKAPKRKPRKPEEQVLHLRSTVRWLSLALVVTLLAFIAAALMMLWMLDGPGQISFFQ